MTARPRKRRRDQPSWRAALGFLIACGVGLFLLILLTAWIAGDRASEELFQRVLAMQAAGRPMTENQWRQASGFPEADARETAAAQAVARPALQHLAHLAPVRTVVRERSPGPLHQVTRNPPLFIRRLGEGKTLDPDELEQAAEWLTERDEAIDQLLEDTAGPLTSGRAMNDVRGAAWVTRKWIELALQEQDLETAFEGLERHVAVQERRLRYYNLREYWQWLGDIEELHRETRRLEREIPGFEAATWFEAIDWDSDGTEWRRTLERERIQTAARYGLTDPNGNLFKVRVGQMGDDLDDMSPYAEWEVILGFDALDQAIERSENPGVVQEALENRWYARVPHERTIDRVENLRAKIALLRQYSPDEGPQDE